MNGASKSDDNAAERGGTADKTLPVETPPEKTFQGKDLWEMLQKPPYSIQLNPCMQEVFETMGYDNVHALARFGEEDFKKIEEFMKNCMHRIIKARAAEEGKDVKEEMKAHYGVYSPIPEEYTILGGFKHTIEACIQAAAKLNKPEPVPRRKSGSMTDHQSSTHSSLTEDEINKIISKETKQLKENTLKWVQAKAPHILNETEEGEETEIEIKVYYNEYKKLMAKVKCPATDCTTLVALNKHPTTKCWNTGNFYRHVTAIHFVRAALEKGKSVSDFFSPKKRKSDETIVIDDLETGNKSSGGEGDSETGNKSSGGEGSPPKKSKNASGSTGEMGENQQ
ncbi:uncharacterized protein LOC117646981 isoform X2 [Thrips palmi]|uniref:Uncharacterized protein LOC117646981 isoform X2 n=1 Tax=Thrips palmi TaxID=161013 RepID=A0A6P8Z2R3_THRPL|nr:uncharacterized protein LOC117646981 isoform X2 [Thrips palmi]